MSITKKLMFLIAFACLNFSVNAQVSYVGKNDLNDKELASLKSSITLFTFQYKDYQELEKFTEAVRSTWTVTPYLIIKPEEISSYIGKPGYSYFAFNGFIQSNGKVTVIRFNYSLKLQTFKKNGKPGKDITVSDFVIYPDNKMLFRAMGGSGFFKRAQDSGTVLSFLYNEGVLYNWSAGMLKSYLKQLNDGILSRKERKITYELDEESKLASLKTDTLYVPDYVKVRFNMFTMSEKIDEEKDEDLTEAYNYPIKFISASELSDLILKKGSNIKYLVYTKSSADKLVSIYNSANNELLYQNYTIISYNFKNKDLERIKKRIK